MHTYLELVFFYLLLLCRRCASQLLPAPKGQTGQAAGKVLRVTCPWQHCPGVCCTRRRYCWQSAWPQGMIGKVWQVRTQAGLILSEWGNGGSRDWKWGWIAICCTFQPRFWSYDPRWPNSLWMTPGQYCAQSPFQFCDPVWPPSWLFLRMVPWKFDCLVLWVNLLLNLLLKLFKPVFQIITISL